MKLFLSYINYGIINWGSELKPTMEHLRKNIEKAIRIMSFKSKKELKTYTTVELRPIEHLFKDLNILNFDKYLQLSFGTLIWKVNNDGHYFKYLLSS